MLSLHEGGILANGKVGTGIHGPLNIARYLSVGGAVFWVPLVKK